MNPIARELDALQLGPARTSGSLTLFSLSKNAPKAPPYLLLDEALAKEIVSVTEVSAAGSVPELRIENRADAPILVVDGEALIGAKQNRICNITVLIPAQTVMNIPVSCVERGRWAYRQKDFSASDHVLYNSSRARKAQDVTASLRTSGAARANQGEIWRDISLKAERMAAASPSEAMSALFARADDRFNAVERALLPHPGEVGAIVATGPMILGVETFDAPSSWERFAPKVLRSYALDAFDDGYRASSHFRDPRDFLQAVRESSVTEFPSVGLGSDLRLDHAHICGGALRALDAVVHVAVFATP
jgi:hypothetical protein